ncbi:MAG: hypothetical protein K2O24_01095 [Muribaculaceae bacterium]|nr:hypothetical protein [Muribaculaceae bacterium]
MDQILVWEGSDPKQSVDPTLSTLPVIKEGVTFFVPVVFNTDNTFGYDGVSIALRILFKYIRNKAKGISIVLLGMEAAEAFMRHYPYPNVLKIPGVSYCLFNQQAVATHHVSTLRTDEREQYLPYLVNLGINRPQSFKSTHSLTNEWCLYKWNSYMGFSDHTDTDNLNLLYLDYIKTIEDLNHVKSKKIENNEQLKTNLRELRSKSARILLVDDNERWHTFFTEFFKGSNITFEAIGAGFKKRTVEEIKEIVAQKVDSFSPDVILLDFRLIEDKDAECSFNQISGNRILQELKGTVDNPGKSFGRQILIFTATSRIENILQLKENFADGFIIKENVEQYASKRVTAKSISKMMADISSAIERARFLVALNKDLNLLDKIANEYIKESDLKVSILTATKSIRLITQNNKLDEGILKLVYLSLFGILEIIKNDTEPLQTYLSALASELHLPSGTQYLLELICEIRNSIAHNDVKLKKYELKGKTLSAEILLEWIPKLAKYICEFLILYSKKSH